MRLYVRNAEKKPDWPAHPVAVLSPAVQGEWFRELKTHKPRREPSTREIANIKLVFLRKGAVLSEAPCFPDQARFGSREEWWQVSAKHAAWASRLKPGAPAERL